MSDESTHDGSLTWVSGDLDTMDAPLKWPLEGVGDSRSVGEAGADRKLLSRDLELGGRGGSWAWAVATSSHSSLLVYTMKLSSRRLSGAQEILPDLRAADIKQPTEL